MNESTFRKQFYVRVGAGACLLFVLVWVFISGGLSPRGFVVGVLISWIVMFAPFVFLTRSWLRSAEEVRKQRITAGVPAHVVERDRYVKGIRAWKRIITWFAIAGLWVLAGYGFLLSQRPHLLPRVVIVALVALYAYSLVGCVRSLMRARKKLKRLEADNPKEPTGLN